MGIIQTIGTLKVGGESVECEPNTFTANQGGATNNAKPAVKDAKIVVNFAEDATDGQSVISWEMANTNENRNVIEGWLVLTEPTTIDHSFRDGDVENYENCMITERPEFPRSADTNISVQFSGNPSETVQR